MSEKKRFDLHLPGLLKVLAEHLYSTKKVGVRELVQNAHDSCVRRKVEEGDLAYRPRIELSVDPEMRLLTIRDNGCGLTAEEIATYLATIGRGYTRELRERLSMASATEAAELIGQFGLGFLSAFLLASEVTLITRSYRNGQPLKWHSAGDEHYDVTPIPEAEIGTTVMLRIKPAASFILQERNLVDTVRTYADFLPTPIYLEGESDSLNLTAPPWESEDPAAAIREYIRRVFPGNDPLWVLPLHDGKVNLGHDTMTVPLRGFLFVPVASIASVREYGDLNIFIRRMFICERERDLLPPWARFVRGVVECPMLQPTASREGIHQDENFESVRQMLEEQLGTGLRQLAEEDPDRWHRLVRGHSDVIVSWAVKDNEFFERVADIVTFRTTRGPQSLPDYLNMTGGTLYYVTRELGSLQEQILAEGADVPAIDASWFAVTPFLEKYAGRNPNVDLVQLDGGVDQLLRPVPESRFAPLLDFYRKRNVPARVAAFKPSEVPGIMIYPPGAELAREAGTAQREGTLPGPMAGLVSAYVEQRFTEADLQGTLCINAACPLVRRLAEEPPPAERRDLLLETILQMARLFCGRMLTVSDAVAAFRDLNKSLEGMVRP